MEKPALPIAVDAALCLRDGLCAMVCPLGIMKADDDGLAVVDENLAKRCIACGHCVSVCPSGALSLTGLAGGPAAPVGAGQPVRKSLAVSLEQAEQFMKTRRSVRRFTPEPPERELLTRLLDDAEYASSGHNARPTEWSVLMGRAAVIKVADLTVEWMRQVIAVAPEVANRFHMKGVVRACEAGMDVICRGAPCLVAAHSPESGATPREDAGIALTYFELLAHAAGLGACWAGFVTFAAAQHPDLKAALGIPPGRVMHGGLMVGTPALKYARIPPRAPARATFMGDDA